jgi:kumamolisin
VALLLIMLSCGVPLAGSASAQGIRRLHPAKPNTVLNFGLGLTLRGQRALDHRLKAPPGVHSPLSPEQFARRFGPSHHQVRAVKRFLGRRHLHLRQVTRSRTSVLARGTVRHIERAFRVSLWVYREVRTGQTFVSIRNKAPRIPRHLTPIVESVSGLDRRPAIVLGTFSDPVLNGHGPPYTDRAPMQGYTPTDLREAYTLNDLSRSGGCGDEGCTGAGQVVGLVAPGSSYDPNNVRVFDSQFGIASPEPENIAVNGVVPPRHDDGEVEAELDIEMVHAIAPAARVRVYETEADTASATGDALSAIVNEPARDRPSAVSMSYGICELSDLFGPGGAGVPELKRVHDLLQQAASEGISVFAASGDWGRDCGASADTRRLGTWWPASDPYVTSVGGTSLYLNEDGTYNAEYAWDQGGVVASGGGVSRLFHSDPAVCAGSGADSCMTSSVGFQSKVYAKSNSEHWRQVPDVASMADQRPGIAIFAAKPGQAAGWIPGGGTSAAAPSWAAFMAVFNQWAAVAPRAPFKVGWANPLLYDLALSSYRPHGPVTQITYNPPTPIDTYIANHPGDALAEQFKRLGAGANCGGPGGPLTQPSVPEGSGCMLKGHARAGWSFAVGLGSYLADTLVEDLAVIQVQPAPVPAGGPIQVLGAQYRPGERVTIRDKTARKALCVDPRAAGDGAVSCSARMPAGAAAGTHRILGLGTKSQRTATFRLIVTAPETLQCGSSDDPSHPWGNLRARGVGCGGARKVANSYSPSHPNSAGFRCVANPRAGEGEDVRCTRALDGAGQQVLFVYGF